MNVTSLALTPKLKKTSAVIGIFDGVHRGHQYLLKKMLATAKASSLTPVVITFFPHPAHVLKPASQLQYIVPLAERLRLLENLGVRHCIVVKFNKKFAHIAPERFIREILVDQLDVKALYVGDDFRFGKDRSGDVALFKTLGQQYGYRMHGVPALKDQGLPVSSTRIRQSLKGGDLTEAKRLLGRPFAAQGKVVKGKQLGRKLGFPTANVDYTNGIMPPNGVYAVKVMIGNKEYPAVANLGFRPTVHQQQPKPLLEVHLFNFSKSIYGQPLSVSFIRKIRDEHKFASLSDLTTQIQADAKSAQKILGLKR